jgi:hypothetical protein
MMLLHQQLELLSIGWVNNIAAGNCRRTVSNRHNCLDLPS